MSFWGGMSKINSIVFTANRRDDIEEVDYGSLDLNSSPVLYVSF